ncbi:D-alanyl-D-alanine carboxypeptidase [Streptomyces sp. NPDC091217]|uniref:D-alanyl-D-alanine carboxypeptidase n=1 Tax=Streptomyces sp. NPDC091217 TaxID=3365975 RepID=UPI0038008B9B
MEEASVAGESPDRSKQRESSAEPTSGSAGSVPEARDPRLAVAAEKETTGGVDTATRIFSVRDLKPNPAEENDTKLREAVAAWVRTGNPAEDTETSEDPETPSEHPADAPEKPEERAERPEDDTEGQEPPQPPKNAQKPNATPEPPTEPDTEPEDAKPADEPKADTEPEDAKPADKAKADAEPEDAKPADKAKADTEPEDAKPADKAKADTEPEDAKPADEPKADAEPEDAKPADEPKGDVRDAVPGDEPADADGEDDPQGPPAPDNDGRTGGAGGNTKTATDDEPEDAKPADEAKADTEPEDAKPADKAKADAEPEDAKPADADGEDTSQGPPAPDNDGRTGGAGGNTKTATEDEDDPQGSAVDQPTTMLKAPRPPQVDQPTTTLKLGGKPKPDPKSPERTSKFVALKSDIQSETKPDAKPDAKPGAKPAAKTETASTTRTTVIPQVGPERTTQQPLPPKPPLDLLAELTNTPPPPETSVRTAIRRVKIWTPLVIVLLIVFAVVQTLRPLPQPTLDLTAKDTYTFDGSKTDIPWPADGQAALDVQGIGTFGSSGDQKPVPIASVAKVMTAYIILRDHPLKSGAAGPKIKIDQAAQDQANAGQESTVDVTAGDSVTQREALESILIASANNIARLLARWDAGSEKSFVVKMNATAKKLGMTNTTYTDPSGLTNSTVSTAVDQVKLAKAAMASEPAFREVAAMMSYDDYKGVNHGNWNQLVGQNNVVGIKTGTTTSALGNLVFAAKKDVNGETRTIIGAVIRQQANASNGNSILKAALNAGDQLIRAAQGALKSATIYKKGDVVGYVDDGLGGRTPVVATQDVTAIGWSGLKVKLSFAADKVPHTAKAGTKVGTLTVGDGSGSAVQVPVALQKDLAEPGFTSKLTRLG